MPRHNAEAIEMVQKTAHRPIVVDDSILSGESSISNTRTPVRTMVETWRRGVQPEAIPNHLPHLSLAQIFDALRDYSDHQAEINHHIECNCIPTELIDPLV